jgi:DNA polymerase-1
MLEFDVETSGLQWYAHEAFLAQWGVSPTSIDEVDCADPRTPEGKAAVQAALDIAPAHGGIRAWNSKFDFHFAEQAGLTLPDPKWWHDGMVLAHVCDERTSVALKARSAALFGEGERDYEVAVKTWLAQETRDRRKAGKLAEKAGEDGTWEQPNYEDVPMELMEPYAKHDCVLTHRTSTQYDQILKQVPKLAGVYALEMRVMDALHQAEKRGIPVDTAGVHRLQHASASLVEGYVDRAAALAGVSHFNPNSSAHVYEALVRRGADVSNVDKLPSGVRSMDKENLASVDDELARAIEDYRAEYRILNTYVRPMLSRSWVQSIKAWKEPFIQDGRLHPNFRQIGARHGRMSCSDPNFQNVPRDDLRIRYHIQADPGYKLVTCDLSSIELVLLMAFAGDGKLLRAYNAGNDMHVLTADMLGLQDYTRAGGHVEGRRDRAKAMNYLQVYGGGVTAIQKKYFITKKEARTMLDRYREAFPEVPQLARRIEFALEDRGYLETPLGRRHRVYNVQREAYKFVNYLISGTAADLLKESLVRIHDAGVPLIAFVHDELIAHVPEADAKEVGELMHREMIDHPVINEKVQIQAEYDIVDRWSQAKKPGFIPDYERRRK